MVAPISRARSDRALIAPFEPVSKPTGLRFPRKRNSEARRTDRPKSPASPSVVSMETATRIMNTPISRVFGGCQEISAQARLRGGPGSWGTTSTKQELAKRWGRLRCFEAQRLLSLLPSPDNAMRRAVVLRDMRGFLFTGVDRRILVIRV